MSNKRVGTNQRILSKFHTRLGTYPRILGTLFMSFTRLGTYQRISGTFSMPFSKLGTYKGS